MKTLALQGQFCGRITTPFTGALRERQQSKALLARTSAASHYSSKPLRGRSSSPLQFFSDLASMGQPLHDSR